MATKKTVIELTLVGGEKVKVDFQQIEEKSRRALKGMFDSAKPVPGALKAVDAASRELHGGVGRLADRLGPLGSALKAIGPAGLAAAGAAGAAGGLLGLAAGALKSVDALEKASERTGIHVEMLQELRFAAAASGASQEELDAALATFTKNVGQAQEGTGRLVSFLEKYDTTLLRNIQNSRSQEEALRLAFDAMGKATSASEKAALGSALFGDSWQRLVPLLKDGAKGVDELREKARELGVVMSEEQVKATKDARDRLDELAFVVQNKAIIALAKLAPSIETIASLALSAASAVSTFFGAFQAADVADTTAEHIDTLKAKLIELRDEQAKLAAGAGGGGGFNRAKALEGLDAEIAALEREIQLQQQLQAKVGARAQTEKDAGEQTADRLAREKAEKEAAERAAREFASEQKKLAGELVKLHEQASTAELEGIAKVQAERDRDIAKYEAALEKKLISEEQFATARTDLEKKAQADITKIQEDEQKKRDDARSKLEETIRDSEQEVTEAVADESEKRRVEFENETADRLVELEKQARAVTDNEDEITAILDGERQRRKTIWEAQAEDASNAASVIGDAFADAFEGIALGTRELDDIPDLFKDAFAKAFFETLREKTGFDKLFKRNIFDLMGTIGDIVLGNGGLSDIFGTAFDAVLGKKAGLDSGLLSKGGSLASSALASYIGADALGTAGAAALGNSATIAAFLAGGGSFVGPGTALTAAEAALLFPSGAVPASFGGVAAAGGAAGGGAGAGGAAGSAAGGLSSTGIGAIVAAAVLGAIQTYSSVNRALEGDVLGGWAQNALDPLGILGMAGVDIANVLGISHIPTKGTQFRKGIGGELSKIFPDLELLMEQFDEAEERFPELFDSALPSIRAVATAIAEMAETPLQTADEVSQIVNILVNSMAAEGRGAEDAIALAEHAMEQLGLTAEDAGKLAVDALEAGTISAEEFEQVIIGLAQIAGVPFEVMRDAILATITDAGELRKALIALGEIDFGHLADVHHPSAGIQDPGERNAAARGDRAAAEAEADRIRQSRAFGGYVDGPVGSEQIIRAHGGEMVVPLHDASAMRAWMQRYGGGGSVELGALRGDVQRLELVLGRALDVIARNTGRPTTVVYRDQLERGLFDAFPTVHRRLTSEQRLPRPRSSGFGIKGDV